MSALRSLSILLVLAIASLAFGQGSLKVEIEAANKSMVVAMKNRDLAAFAKIAKPASTHDFKYSLDRGRALNFDQMVSTIKTELSRFGSITGVEKTVVSTMQLGDNGKASQRLRIDGSVIGSDKRSHKLVLVIASSEIYRRVNGKWKAAIVEAWTTRRTIDGKWSPKQVPAGGGKG